MTEKTASIFDTIVPTTPDEFEAFGKALVDLFAQHKQSEHFRAEFFLRVHPWLYLYPVVRF